MESSTNNNTITKETDSSSKPDDLEKQQEQLAIENNILREQLKKSMAARATERDGLEAKRKMEKEARENEKKEHVLQMKSL